MMYQHCLRVYHKNLTRLNSVKRLIHIYSILLINNTATITFKRLSILYLIWCFVEINNLVLLKSLVVLLIVRIIKQAISLRYVKMKYSYTMQIQHKVLLSFVKENAKKYWIMMLLLLSQYSYKEMTFPINVVLRDVNWLILIKKQSVLSILKVMIRIPLKEWNWMIYAQKLVHLQTILMRIYILFAKMDVLKETVN